MAMNEEPFKLPKPVSGLNSGSLTDSSSRKVTSVSSSENREACPNSPSSPNSKQSTTADAFSSSSENSEVTTDPEASPEGCETAADVVPSSKSSPLVYEPPPWSGQPPENFRFEVIKNGTIISVIPCNKPYLLVGRLPNCDLFMAHPSVSRLHAAIQYSTGTKEFPPGFYVYDMSSTHGTFMNKECLKIKTYYHLQVGYLLKFGLSTRLLVFQGPVPEKTENPAPEKTENPAPEKTENSALEKTENPAPEKTENPAPEKTENPAPEKTENPAPEKTENPAPEKTEPEAAACDWGMSEDAEDDDLTENPFALETSNEDLYLDDPKKTLRGWFEREGYTLEYKVEEKGVGSFVCSVELPLDTPTGKPIMVDASVTGKKKEAVVACALEACRTLDRYGVLRQSKHESRQPKKKNWEDDDFYDSDEDPFLDRTGTLEKKREWRKKQGSSAPVESYQSIIQKLSNISNEINKIKEKLGCSDEKTSALDDRDMEIDPLDLYMSKISDPKKVPLDPVAKSKLRHELLQLQNKKEKYEKLRDIAANPFQLQSVQSIREVAMEKVAKKQGTRIIERKAMHINRTKSSGFIAGSIKDQNSLRYRKFDRSGRKAKSASMSSEGSSQIESTGGSSKSEITELGIETTKGESKVDKKYQYTPSFFNTPTAVALNPAVPNMTLLQKSCTKQEQAFIESSDVLNDKRLTDLIDTEEYKIFGQNIAKGVKRPLFASASEIMKRQSDKILNTGPKTDRTAEYSMWLPPQNQPGDGTTSLNKKYGY